MADPLARLNAVIAALEKIHDHVSNLAGDDDVDAGTYNRWIGMLEGVIEGNWKNLALPEGVLPAEELLMHIDAAIAFLERHREG